MTAGSWTTGNPDDGTRATGVYAEKSWSGSDGKSEAWSGGTRLKWNNYNMKHWAHSWTYVLPYVVGALSNQNPSSLKALCGWNANDDLRLLAKLAEVVRGHSFDLGINIAEGRKTYEQILGNLASIGKSLVALKHGQIGDAFHHLGVPEKGWRRLRAKDISGRWLEMQYGWLPLVSQSFEAGKALAAATGPRVLTFSASIAQRRATYDGSQIPFLYSYPVNVSYSKRIKAELYEDISLNRSLGLVDPLAIAWEVVPYSFVVDWFLPVGTYLSAWSVIPKLNGRFMTTERIGQKAGKIVLKPDAFLPPRQYSKAVRRDMWFYTNRIVSSSLSVPMPTFNRVDKALSPKRLLNAVSLVHQLLS